MFNALRIKVALLLVCIPLSLCARKAMRITSPHQKIAVEVSESALNTWQYAIKGDGRQLFDPSQLGYKATDGSLVPGEGWHVHNVSRRRIRSVWKPIWGKRAIVPDAYQELRVCFGNEACPPYRLDIVFRAYDDGVAFRYEIPQEAKDSIAYGSEETRFAFADDFTAWFYNGENHNIGPNKMTDCDGEYLPVMTVRADERHYLAVHEACIGTNDPFKLFSKKGETSFSIPNQSGVLRPGFQSAWRVVFYGNTPGTLTDSHLLELLNPDPSPAIDFSWVKPGVAVWDWRINGAEWDGFRYTMSYPSWVRMVDFAAEQGFKYLVLDANWYGPEFEKESDPTKGGAAGNVQELIRYACGKGVGIWLYLNDVGGKCYPIERTLAQYADWGAAGVKYGFMRGDMLEKNHWTQHITALCAKNHLLVDFHDNPVHPYGQMRTWPNAVTREYCHAQLDGHHVFLPKTFVTTVFVNMVAGPLDMNNGMFDLRQGNTTRVDESQPVPATLVAEAARTLITWSGVTILPDIPEYYRKYPSLLSFLSAQSGMPWIESRTLAGEIGEYIVMMRETQDAYLIGAATNEENRTIEIPLDFLPKGSFQACVVEDGEDAHYLNNRESLRTSKVEVNRKSHLQVRLACGGGACITISKH